MKAPGPRTQAAVRNMRALRLARGWTAAETCRRLGETGLYIDRAVLAKTEGGRKETFSVDLLFALAEVFGVQPWVLTEAEPICVTCAGMAPSGFKCLACGRENAQ